MKYLTILFIFLNVNYITADCLSKDALLYLNFTNSDTLINFPDSDPLYCVDIWKAHGSCVKTEAWETQIAENTDKLNDKPHGRSSKDEPDTDKVDDAQHLACHNVRYTVLNKYTCLLTSGKGSSIGTFTADNFIETLTIDDSDAQSVFDACAKLEAERCSDILEKTSTLEDIDEKLANHIAECKGIIACVAANESNNCLSDIKNHIVDRFKRINSRELKEIKGESLNESDGNTPLNPRRKGDGQDDKRRDGGDRKQKKFDVNPQGLVNLLGNFRAANDK